MINDASIVAYESLKQSGRLGKNMAIVLMVFIKEARPLTALDVIKLLVSKYDLPMTHCESRITELTAQGFLRKCNGLRIGAAHSWEWTGWVGEQKGGVNVLEKVV